MDYYTMRREMRTRGRREYRKYHGDREHNRTVWALIVTAVLFLLIV